MEGGESRTRANRRIHSTLSPRQWKIRAGAVQQIHSLAAQFFPGRGESSRPAPSLKSDKPVKQKERRHFAMAAFSIIDLSGYGVRKRKKYGNEGAVIFVWTKRLVGTALSVNKGVHDGSPSVCWKVIV